MGLLFKEEAGMYLTDIVWWGYTLAVVAVAVFLLIFASKIQQKGG
jgi:hypothetical protein